MTKEIDVNNVQIEELVSNPAIFNSFVYTPIDEVTDNLKKRRRDKKLVKNVQKYLKNDIPIPIEKNFKAVLFRQLFTPNYELIRFMELANALGMKPMFLEYLEDKFTNYNAIKYALGKMKFLGDFNNQKTTIISKNVIEFNSSNGKKISEVETIFKTSLVDFHHELLEFIFPKNLKYLFDTSTWFFRGGQKAKIYYDKYIALFVRNAVLFENFVLEGEELAFIKEVFLPSFINIWKTFNTKPLIVQLLPEETQNDDFWLYYPVEIYKHIEANSNKN